MRKDQASVREICVDILTSVLSNGRFADELLAQTFRRTNMSGRDKALLIELVNGTLRWHGQLEWVLARYFRGNYSRSPIRLRGILEVTLYQLRFLTKIPRYAAVSEGVEMAKRVGGSKWGDLVNALLRNYLRTEKALRLPSIEGDDPSEGLSINYSHPKWLISRWLKQYGFEETRLMCEKNNRRPEISVRVNKNRTSKDALLNELAKLGIEAKASRYFDDFVKIPKLRDLTSLPSFARGHFSVQDESTAIPTLLLAPEDGDVVLDLCAAPGGKTGHLAYLAGNSGTVIAVDNRFDRMKRLTENIRRLGLNSVVQIVADSRSVRLRAADRILVDSPCSGLGVLAKRTDLRWQRKMHHLFRIRELQEAILENAARLLRPGGSLVYSTCTLEPEETEAVVKSFLKKHHNFSLATESNSLNPRFCTPQGFWKSLPHVHNMDGTFAVKLQKRS